MIIIEALDSEKDEAAEVEEATNAFNITSKMSSRGGEASGAAASCRARVSGRQPAAGGGGCRGSVVAIGV
jgi:hypothetical protein